MTISLNHTLQRTLTRLSPPNLTHRSFSTTSRAPADFTHAVIGAGAVGLAIARRLQSRPDNPSTLLLERHRHAGTETSSRNSEVIHAGLYYGHDTLKTKLCIRGREMMYDLCKERGIGYRNCGKWIVAQDAQQMEALEGVHQFSKEIGVPTHFVSFEEGRRREPEVRARAGILESPTTGIVDSHGYMQYLQGDFEEQGGDVAFGAAVTRIEAIDAGKGGWRIWTGEDCVTAEVLVNSAGLAAIGINNYIMPEERHKKPYFAKGSYFSYSSPSPKPGLLVYPAPVPGHGGLGTHLTLDLAGRVRFGPDLEWVEDPTDLKPNPSRLEEAMNDIETYLPGLKRDAVDLDYCGIRPKLGKMSSVVHGKNFLDFHIVKEEGFEGFVNLLGIESPGLTSSLAIAEYVEKLLYK